MSVIKERKQYQIASLMAFILLLSSCGGSEGGSAAGGSLTGSSVTAATPAYAYVATIGTLATYSIDPSTFALTASGGSPLTFSVSADLGGISRIAIDPSGQFLYLLHTAGIYAYTINRNTGALTQIPGSPFESGIGLDSLAFDASGTHLYVAGSTSVVAPVNTVILSYSIDSSGALVPVASYTLSNELYTLARAGNYLYAAGFYANSITVFSITPSGELEGVPGSPFATDVGPHSIAVDPSGSVLYAANDGGPTPNEPVPGSISAFTIDPSTGALTPVAGSPFPIAVTGAISIDNMGRFLFVLETGGVSVYAINSPSGALSRVAGSPFSAGTDPGLVTVSPTDQTVYVADGGSADISEFTLGDTGVITPLPGSPFPIGGDACCMAIAWK